MKTIVMFLVGVAGCGGSNPVKTDGGAGNDLTMESADLIVVRDLSHDMTQLTCDPTAMGFAGDCSDPSKKCTEVAIDQTMTTLAPECVTITGMKMNGDPCTRVNDTAGMDDCGKGLFCSSLGSYFYPPPMGQMPNRHCRAFCSADADCKTVGSRCSVLDMTLNLGLCAPTCTFFGTDCMQGYDCGVVITDIDGMNIYGTCRFVGNVAVGAACKSNIDCAGNMICNIPMGAMAGTCASLCDKTHACPQGKMCMALTMTNLANGLGFCM